MYPATQRVFKEHTGVFTVSKGLNTPFRGNNSKMATSVQLFIYDSIALLSNNSEAKTSELQENTFSECSNI